MALRLNHFRIDSPLSGRQDGNMLIYVIVVMMLFAALGTALVSIYTTSNLVAVISDDARQAGYLAESGIRYAVGELKKVYTRAAIQALNENPDKTDKTYTLSGGDSFTVNVFPKWFRAAAGVSVTTGETVDLNVPDGATIPENFKIKDGVYLVNINGLRDAIAFGGDKTRFIAEVYADSANVDADTLRVTVNDAFQAGENQPVHMALYPNAVYPSPGPTPIAVDGSADLVVGLDDPQIAETVFHKNGGTFYVLNPSTGVRRMYSYESYTTASPVTLKKIRGLASLSIDPARDLIIFSDKNHTVTAQGRTGPSSSGATEHRKIDLPQNTASAPVWAPETAEETPADIAVAGFLKEAYTPYSTPGTVVFDDPANRTQVSLGMGIGTAASAVWYGGDLDVGGVSGNFCSAGKCRFEYGMRAYFTLAYNGTGDGFTFALKNGTDNIGASLGGVGGSLGYAGTGSGGGIQLPKMALELDTYANTGQNDPGCENSPATHKDYLNFDFWGVSDASLDDDNTHDTWASIDTLHGNIRSTPYVESAGNILVASDDGYLYRLDPKGVTQKSFNLGVSTDSSPIVDSSGRIWIGTNDTYINAVDSTLSSFLFPQTRIVGGNVRTIPVFDPVTGRVFFGSDYSGTATPSSSQCNFCAFSLAGAFQWGFNSGDVIQGSPTVKGGYVYFGGNLGAGSQGDVWKYYTTSATRATSWSTPYLTTSDVQVRPAVSAAGVVFFGSWENDSYFHAVKPDKTVKWKYNTGYVSIYSSAALDETRNRVYFGTTQIQSGSFDGKIYALNSETGALVWAYQTGGAIWSSPVIGTDGAVVIGSDDGYLYCFEPGGALRWRLNLKDAVRSSPTLKADKAAVYVGADTDRLYSVPVTGNPWQFKTWADVISGTAYERYLTYGDNLPANALAADNPVSSSNNWLNSGPWAVRVEVDRSKTANARGTYEYTIRSWIRQCKLTPGDCSEITGSYFSDTRIVYGAKPAQMSQSFELSAADHAKFDTYYNGFTQGTGSVTQTITLRNIRVGFVRPGDYTVYTDPKW